MFVSLQKLCAAPVDIPPGEHEATISIAPSWSLKSEGELTHAISPDGHVHFLIAPVERGKVAETIGEVMRYVRNTSDIIISPKSLAKELRSLNGRDAEFISWRGTQKTEPVEIWFVVLRPEAVAPFIAAYWASPEALTEHRKELDDTLRSVRKARRD